MRPRNYLQPLQKKRLVEKLCYLLLSLMVLSNRPLVMTFLWGRFALYYHNSFVVVAMNNRGRGGVNNLNMWLVVVVPLMWCVM